MMNNQQKRKTTRVKPNVSQPIEVQIMSTGSLDILAAIDISVSGIGVRVPHKFAGCATHEEVELVITLPKSQPFLAHGIIIHISGRRGGNNDVFGVQFTQINEKNLLQIKSYIDSHLASAA